MNSLQTTFNQTRFNNNPYKTFSINNMDSNMNTRKKINDFDFYNNQANNASLKGKIKNLDEELKITSEELNDHKKDISGLQLEKNTLKDILLMKTTEVKNSLLQELDKVEEEMKRHYSHQIAENNRMLQQISSLKSEKTTLMNQLIALQRRLLDLEEQVGHEEHKS